MEYEVKFQYLQYPTQMKDVGETFKKLGYYFATVIIGLAIHGGLTLPIIMGNTIH